MIGNGRLGDDGFHTGLGVLEARTVDADALHKALGQHGLIVHVEHLILERGTAAVDNENLH